MFKNNSTDNLLDNLEQELIELESPTKLVEQIQQQKTFKSPPSAVSSNNNDPPKPRQRNVFMASTSAATKSLKKNEKNDENEIIQLSSISSEFLRTSQSSPTLSEKNDEHSQTSSFYSTGGKMDAVTMINEKPSKSKMGKKINVQVVHETDADKTSAEPETFFVIKHGKWAETDTTKTKSPKSQQILEEDKIVVEKEPEVEHPKVIKTEIAKKPEKPVRTFKSKFTKNKKVDTTSTSSNTPSVQSSTLSSSSEEEVSPTPKKKHVTKNKKSKDIKKILKTEDDNGTEEVSVEEESVDDSKGAGKEVVGSQAIGIHIFNTGKLQYNPSFRNPRIKISLYNEDNGNQLTKSTNKSPIEPIFSRKGSFTEDFFDLSCNFNDTLVINEDVHRLRELYNNVLIFFEMINENDVNLCWAFLKLFSPKFINIEKTLKLQFYEFQKPKRQLKFKGKTLEERKELTIYEQWQRKDRKKFPSHLNVLITSLQFNKTSGTPAADNVIEATETTKIPQDNLNVLPNWRKLPGQACKVPNKLLHKIILHDKGSMIVKFSCDGNFLVYTEVQRDKFVIHVRKFPEMREIFTLNEHTDLIHDIDWFKEKSMQEVSSKLMLTCSSDYTAIVWNIQDSEYTYNILPHPCFVYSSKFLQTEDHRKIYIATGGRDAIIRIWRNKKLNKGYELHQELTIPETTKDVYITGIATKCSEYFYTSTSAGIIYEYKFGGKTYSLHRTFDLDELRNKIITCIDLHSRGNKIYIKCFDFADSSFNNFIYILGIPSGVITQRFRISAHACNFVNFGLHSKLKCSPCGTLLFSTDLDNKEKINYYQLVNGTINTNNVSDGDYLHVKFHLGEKNFISSLDYHPKDFYLAYTIYGKNGGIGVYGFDVDKNYNNKIEQLQNGTTTLFKSRVEPYMESSDKTTIEIKHFSDIIRRLDEVFLIPKELNRDRSDDQSEKENGTYTVDSKRSVTYTVVKKPDAEPELAIGKSSKHNANDSDNNLTYSIKNNNTYDITKTNRDSDDTTISESLN